MSKNESRLPGENTSSQPQETAGVGHNSAGADQKIDIEATLATKPHLFLIDDEARAELFAWVEAKAGEVGDKVSSAKARDQIRSAAASMARAKATIDRARKELTKAWRDKVAGINETGKTVDERLADAATAMRAPLTAWEDAEEKRKADQKNIINDIRVAGIILIEDTSETVKARGKKLFEMVLDKDLFGDRIDEAEAIKNDALRNLMEAKVRLTREEQDKAELEALRAERAEREKADREKAEAEEAEKRAAEAKRAEEARIEQAREKAAQEAREQAAREAEAEQRRRDAERQAEIDAANARAAEAEAQAKREAEQREAEKLAEDAERKRIADEQAARERDAAHRAKVKGEAVEAIVTTGIPKTKAEKLVQAIIAGDIPHISMGF